jgi:hypothetical protein
LVFGYAVVRVGAVELGGVEAEGVAAGGRVALKAIGAAGVAPGLRAGCAVFGDDDDFVFAGFGDEGSLGLLGVPAVGDAVEAGRGFNEETGFETA